MLQGVTKISIAVMCLGSLTVLADETKECYGCSAADLKDSARSWGQSYVTRGRSEELHLIDIKSTKVTTFKVTKEKISRDEKRRGISPRIFLSSARTPNRIVDPMKQLKNHVGYVKQALNPMVIPASVIPESWALLNCGYCDSNVKDYINNHASGEIERVTLTLDHIIRMFGLTQTSIPNNYQIPLESGGYLILELVITNNSMEVRVVKSIDEDNNSVPFDSKNLKGRGMQIRNLDNADRINSHLKRFGLYIPRRKGVTYITDCKNKECK